MEESILNSTKTILGVADDYTAFDLDILTHINSSFSVITQIGVGPVNGFSVEDNTAKWGDLDLPQEQLGLLRTLIFLKVRMLFDPPGTSFLIEAMNKQIDEHLIRLSYMREALIEEDSSGEPIVIPGESASGVQLTPAYVWIMDHNLGFTPAGFKFFELETNEELEPEEIQYVNNNRTLALWPTQMAGRWRVS